MAKCNKCGAEVPEEELQNGVCKQCAAAPDEQKDQADEAQPAQ